MKFKDFSSYLEKLETISSRNEITRVLSELFKNLDKDESDKASYLLLGSLAPEFKGIVFNIAEKMMLRVFSKAYEVSDEMVYKEYKNLGDMGKTALRFADLKKNQSSNVSISEVFDNLWDIAIDKGAESQERKVDKTVKLLKKVDSISAKFIVRIMLGRLRLGFSDKTVLDALSYYEFGDKSGKADLETAYNVLPDVGYIAKQVLERGIKNTTKDISPRIGYPLLPMLPARLKSPVEMIKKMTRVFVEPKFDGLRIQLHFKESGIEGYANLEDVDNNMKKVRAFTRKPNEVSWMFPELSELNQFVNAKEIILDSEAIGVDSTRKALANFQTTMTRRRKHDIAEISKKVSIRFNVFDVMYLDGKSLIDTPYEARREILKKMVRNGDLLKIVDYEITENPERIAELMQSKLGEGLEGIIVKKADAGYIAGRTGYRWVKMKEKESQKAKLADTIDAIVMGYYKGRGKRTVFGLGGFLVGTLDGEVVKTLTKIGTGLSDDQFRELKERLISLETLDKPKVYGNVDKTIMPDVWVEPGLVTEIAADEITASDKSSSGYSLRFPRLVKFRDDKKWTGATSLKEIKNLFKLQ